MGNYFNRDILVALAFWLILAFVAWIYWPGLTGPSVFDDGVNLMPLSSIDENLLYYRDIVFENKSGPLGRPVSMLSFVFTQAFSSGSIWWFKYHNLLIHLLCGCLIFLFARQIFVIFNLAGAVYAAFFTAAFWLVSPLFVSTVLYPVQRMAQLSTLFSLAALLCYTKFSIAILIRNIPRALFFLIGSLLFVFLSIFSKENGVVTLFLIGSIEVYVIGRLGQVAIKSKLILTSIVLICSALVGFFAVLHLSDNYSFRSFTLYERLLTEFRILWSYVQQLFIPDTNNMGLIHDDYPVSKSLFSPKTTFYSFLAWLLVIATGVAAFFWRALHPVAFGFSFFILGHSIESTIVPLELYFEHRNYLPAVGLIMIFTFYTAKLAQRVSSRYVYAVLWGVSFVVLSWKSAILIETWSNDRYLTIRYMTYHPESVRTQSRLANTYASLGRLDRALEHSNSMHRLKSRDSSFEHAMRDVLLACIARADADVIYNRFEVDQKSVQEGSSSEILYKIAQYIQNDRCNSLDVDRFLELLNRKVIYTEFVVPELVYGAVSIIEISRGNYENAISYIDKWLSRGNQDPGKPLLMALYASFSIGDDELIQSYMKRLEELNQNGQLSLEQRDDFMLFRQDY